MTIQVGKTYKTSWGDVIYSVTRIVNNQVYYIADDNEEGRTTIEAFKAIMSLVNTQKVIKKTVNLSV